MLAAAVGLGVVWTKPPLALGAVVLLLLNLLSIPVAAATGSAHWPSSGATG